MTQGVIDEADFLACASGECRLEGELEREGSGSRYFRLRSNLLYEFARHGDARPLRCILLEGADVLIEDCVINISTITSTEHRLKAANEREARRWYSHLVTTRHSSFHHNSHKNGDSSRRVDGVRHSFAGTGDRFITSVPSGDQRVTSAPSGSRCSRDHLVRDDVSNAAGDAVDAKRKTRVIAKSDPVTLWIGSWNVGCVEPTLQTLKEWIPKGHGMYCIGFQEAVSLESTAQNLDTILGKDGCVRLDIDLKVSGRGDGSLIQSKHTTMFFYVAPKKVWGFRLVRSGVRRFNRTGSKGAVCLVCCLQQTTLCFVCCHCEANDAEERTQHFREIISEMSNLGGVRGGLESTFHHTFIFGDLNYRCVTTTGELMPAEEVCQMLERGQRKELFENHDQLKIDQRKGIVYSLFNEPEEAADFFPTYKKFENRETKYYDDASWVRETYRINYTEPWHKGGRVKERTPGWCDRILFHSLDSIQSDVDPVAYKSHNDGGGFSISDHSPVSSTFEVFPVRHFASPANGHFVSLDLELTLCRVDAIFDHIRKISVAFPLPFEQLDGNRASMRGQGWLILERSNCWANLKMPVQRPQRTDGHRQLLLPAITVRWGGTWDELQCLHALIEIHVGSLPGMPLRDETRPHVMYTALPFLACDGAFKVLLRFEGGHVSNSRGQPMQVNVAVSNFKRSE